MRDLRRKLLSFSGVNIEGGDLFIDSGLKIRHPSRLHIGYNVSLGDDNHFWAFNDIYIGSWTQTAKDLLVISGSHEIDSFDPISGKSQEVEIGPGCWIGARVTILGGSKLGPGSVVGAGSLVSGIYPAWSVIAGVPAKVIRKRIPTRSIRSPFGSYAPSEVDPNYLDNLR